MKKLPKVIILGVGLATLFALGQGPAQADTDAAPKHKVVQYDTGWD